MSRTAKIRIGHWALAILVFGALEFLVRSRAVSALIISPPSAVLKRLVADLDDTELWKSILTTVPEVLTALLFSSILGMSLGYLLYRYSNFQKAVEPWLVAFYSAPAMLLYPIVMSFLGQGSATVIVMAVILGTVPLAINVAVGFHGLEPIWLKVGRSLIASKSQVLLKILIPASIPIVVTGLRLGMTFALIGVISMEFLTYSGGLGKLISWRYFTFDTDGVYSAIFLVAVMAVSINALVTHGQRQVVTRWAGATAS